MSFVTGVVLNMASSRSSEHRWTWAGLHPRRLYVGTRVAKKEKGMWYSGKVYAVFKAGNVEGMPKTLVTKAQEVGFNLEASPPSDSLEAFKIGSDAKKKAYHVLRGQSDPISKAPPTDPADADVRGRGRLVLVTYLGMENDGSWIQLRDMATTIPVPVGKNLKSSFRAAYVKYVRGAGRLYMARCLAASPPATGSSPQLPLEG